VSVINNHRAPAPFHGGVTKKTAQTPYALYSNDVSFRPLDDNIGVFLLDDSAAGRADVVRVGGRVRAIEKACKADCCQLLPYAILSREKVGMSRTPLGHGAP
jgi:hypothetical protein